VLCRRPSRRPRLTCGLRGWGEAQASREVPCDAFPAVSSRNIPQSFILPPLLDQQPTLSIPKWLSYLSRSLLLTCPNAIGPSTHYDLHAIGLSNNTQSDSRKRSFPGNPLLSNQQTKSAYPSYSHPVPIIWLLLDLAHAASNTFKPIARELASPREPHSTVSYARVIG